MGSIHYFLKELSKEIEITINPEEAKYIATCSHPKSYQNSNNITRIIEKLDKSIKNNSVTRLKASEILYTFPTLATKIIYDGISILKYFESMEEFGHNKTLIQNIIKIVTTNPALKEKKVFKDLLSHAYDCSVQLGKFENGMAKVWSPSGIKEVRVDERYIAGIRNWYFTTHGKNENGLRIAVRYLNDPKIIECLKKLEDLWDGLPI